MDSSGICKEKRNPRTYIGWVHFYFAQGCIKKFRRHYETVTELPCYGAGGGLTEVFLTPIVEACPIERKDQAVSMLHAFYCWGSVIVIVVSTVFFRLAGLENWKLQVGFLFGTIFAVLMLVGLMILKVSKKTRDIV